MAEFVKCKHITDRINGPRKVSSAPLSHYRDIYDHEEYAEAVVGEVRYRTVGWRYCNGMGIDEVVAVFDVLSILDANGDLWVIAGERPDF